LDRDEVVIAVDDEARQAVGLGPDQTADGLVRAAVDGSRDEFFEQRAVEGDGAARVATPSDLRLADPTDPYSG
jgi:hypothetical protein